MQIGADQGMVFHCFEASAWVSFPAPGRELAGSRPQAIANADPAAHMIP